MEEPDISTVASVASALHRRLYQLTSAWSGVPLDVHRLQESVSRACMILQSTLDSETKKSLSASSWSTMHTTGGPIHEQLSAHMASAREVLDDLADVLVFVQPHSDHDLIEISRRWKQRREEIASLRLKLDDCIRYVLTEVSLLNIEVSTSSTTPGQAMSVTPEYDSSKDTSTARARISSSVAKARSSGDTSPTYIGQRSNLTMSAEIAIEKDFDLKFRNVDFAEWSRGVNVADGGPSHMEAGEKFVIRPQDDRAIHHVVDEQKSLVNAHLEPKSLDSLRGARMQTNALGEHQTPRQAHNEEGFRHLERVFQMISPFGSQDEDWMAPDHSFESIRSSASQTRDYPKKLSVVGGQRPRPSHLGLALRSHHPQEGCHPSCSCVCHSQAHIGRGALSAFKTALGSFTFIFNTRSSNTSCTIPSCVGRRGQYFQVIYTFPSWLLHAAISATVKDWTIGSPELLLRVHRRIDAGMMATYTSIFGYITRGDVENVKRVLSRREASVYDVAGVAGVSMLYHALRLRQIDVVELLLCEGADVFQLDDAGLGPFHEAIQVMYTSASTPFQERLQGILPMDQIMEAAELTDLHKIAMGILWASVADYVASKGSDHINAGDSNSQTPLYYASARGNTGVVQALLETGAYPDGVPESSSSSSSLTPFSPPPALQSLTPLGMAARNGHLDVVQRLMHAGAQVNVRSKHNRTALHECSPPRGDRSLQYTYVEVAACLLAHGADLHVVDNYGSTVLDSTCIRDHARVAAFFVERGIDTTHRDWEGSNALDNCICFDSLECAAFLLGLGSARSGVWNVDDNGSSTLHYMATGGSAEMMELFAKSGLCGLDAELKDKQGQTALDVFNNGRSGITQELRDTFMWFLHEMSRQDTGGPDSHDSDIGSEAPEFFDAAEYLS